MEKEEVRDKFREQFSDEGLIIKGDCAVNKYGDFMFGDEMLNMSEMRRYKKAPDYMVFDIVRMFFVKQGVFTNDNIFNYKGFTMFVLMFLLAYCRASKKTYITGLSDILENYLTLIEYGESN